jgi:hypothetical protein
MLRELELMSKDVELGIRSKFLTGGYKADMPVELKLNVVRSLILTSKERWEAIAMQDGLAQVWGDCKPWIPPQAMELPEFQLLDRLLSSPTAKRADERKTDPDDTGTVVPVEAP